MDAQPQTPARLSPWWQQGCVLVMVFAFRQVLADREWTVVEQYIRVSFWGLNVGLALMIVTNLFPGGVAQFVDVLTKG